MLDNNEEINIIYIFYILVFFKSSEKSLLAPPIGLSALPLSSTPRMRPELSHAGNYAQLWICSIGAMDTILPFLDMMVQYVPRGRVPGFLGHMIRSSRLPGWYMVGMGIYLSFCFLVSSPLIMLITTIQHCCLTSVDNSTYIICYCRRFANPSTP